MVDKDGNAKSDSSLKIIEDQIEEPSTYESPLMFLPINAEGDQIEKPMMEFKPQPESGSRGGSHQSAETPTPAPGMFDKAKSMFGMSTNPKPKMGGEEGKVLGHVLIDNSSGDDGNDLLYMTDQQSVKAVAESLDDIMIGDHELNSYMKIDN